jgi:alpha-beta hydrolase superfamily lysophospholipase
VPTARVNGIDLFYQEVGDPATDPLLLTMGWGADHAAWAFQTPVFAGRFRVIAFDDRGAGQSASPDTPFSIADMADDAVALLDHLGIARAHVAGASMGGMIEVLPRDPRPYPARASRDDSRRGPPPLHGGARALQRRDPGAPAGAPRR